MTLTRWSKTSITREWSKPSERIFAIIAVVSLWLAMRREGLEPPRWLRGRPGIVAASALVFLWLNAALLRTIQAIFGLDCLAESCGAPVLPELAADS